MTTTTAIFSFTLVFLVVIPKPVYSQPTDNCSSILQVPSQERCNFSLAYCSSDSLFNYFTLHFCRFHQSLAVSVPVFALIILFHFYFLIQTASLHFSTTVTRLASVLRLSPSMAGVTLLALGNGAPDAFASAAALRVDRPRLGLGAVLSAGAFVSGFVFGIVALYAAPFAVRPSQFFRDGFFYLIATSGMFYMYLTGSVFLWQAVGLIGLYLLFVAVVIWMDLATDGEGKDEEKAISSDGHDQKQHIELLVHDKEFDDSMSSGCKDSKHDVGGFIRKSEDKENLDWAFINLRKVSSVWEVPVSTILKLTIPSTVPAEWSRFYSSMNIVLCPIALLYSLSSFIPFHHPIVFLVPNVHFPLWLVVLFQCLILGTFYYFLTDEPPDIDQMLLLLMSFAMSVLWISLVAGELLSCLSAVGIILNLPPALLGLTVLAWGNSVGDLVADVAVAKAGQPAMAIAGCFAGPMFNMLIGFGSALVFGAVQKFPEGYNLIFNSNIIVAFVFLLLSLMGSLLVVAWFRFRVPRFWGFCLVGAYALFIIISLLLAEISE
ncbi:Cation/calcium exchanger 5 [Nymphaea thermarum]|nr:Cation/calcium exchanger 5 [Nymphaea thermarum]